MHVEMWPIDKVIPYARNPRKNDASVDAVAASIKEFGFRQPIVVDASGVIVVGHTRHKAARRLGMSEVPVHVANNLTPEQAKAYRLADNSAGSRSEWDADLLRLELDELPDFDAAAFGLDLSDVGIETPDFQPVGADEQGRLDQKSPIKCPNCHKFFTP